MDGWTDGRMEKDVQDPLLGTALGLLGFLLRLNLYVCQPASQPASNSAIQPFSQSAVPQNEGKRGLEGVKGRQRTLGV